MPEHVSIYQLVGVGFLVLVTLAWTLGLAHMLRRGRFEAALRRAGGNLPALPSQRRAAPRLECVELTPAEEDAFAGLVRQFSDGR
ncbi:hypothetical protein F7R91_12260 [Streptomyces luteolifulvus]|jgi:hypothetical protein|uniref:Uncharacterized protein n=1 Tax=Streptomyces luteolifulvus TaxID=2615112 RepID=A0A6H9V2I1_9ACTN|nr:MULTISPECIES: hypothetical protein [Streptomyces]KAB1147107.1 hypothetical protein F7R91_12260 [Streptomyces luteolifulvus]MXM68333.1 hypothetical protein [Streptomyces sp. HUCO-GS316]